MGAMNLAQLLLNQKFLAFVNLKGNSIGDGGFRELCKVLPKNQTLLSINIEKNQITSKGIEYLNKVIRGSDQPLKIREIIISKNDIGNSAIQNLI